MIRRTIRTPAARRLQRRGPRLTAVASLVALAATLAACGSDSDGGSASGGDQIVVGYSGYTLSNPYFAGLIKGLEEGAEAHGFKLLQTNSNGDNNTQVNDIQNLVTKGADYVVISPADSSAIIPAVKAVRAAGACRSRSPTPSTRTTSSSRWR